MDAIEEEHNVVITHNTLAPRLIRHAHITEIDGDISRCRNAKEVLNHVNSDLFGRDNENVDTPVDSETLEIDVVDPEWAL